MLALLLTGAWDEDWFLLESTGNIVAILSSLFGVVLIVLFLYLSLAHLELIMCQVPETFARDLMEIPSLQTLSIWPDTFCEQVSILAYSLR